ncbi:EmrB/QacA family drug resistance transporter [Streptomyces himastatinicus ATCC 53653]|uniref:EmrB/QacA family drug resistance transporter n=1 Tax=Streptomyces himastatinicus ATCC 53653 TaxID=457427 RepID=D9WRY5_9ACTN|nr:MFS transporter [Streptomyces himastatinicus]EFL28229.1 EmrB/QacA family drug resistance transporter [Streptomyces himastatinicus ATCC 53653]
MSGIGHSGDVYGVSPVSGNCPTPHRELDVMMRRAGTLLLPLVAVFLVPFTLTGASVALTDISEQLDASLAATQWVVNAYSATFAGFMLITGALADRLGRRRVFVSGVALFAVCALISAVAQDIVVLDVARLISGIGAAATTTGASAVLAEAFTGQARSKVFGLFGTTIGIGLAFGPTLAGLLVDSWGWRSAFALPGVIGLGCVVFYRSLPASRPATTRGQLDRAGGTLFTLALLLLIFALVEGPELGWGSVAVAGSLIASVVLSGAFVAVERRVAEPLLDFRLFGTGRFLGLCLAVVAVVGLFGPLLTYLPAYFRAVAGMSTGEAGLSMVALTGPVLFIPLICGALVRWIPGLGAGGGLAGAGGRRVGLAGDGILAAPGPGGDGHRRGRRAGAARRPGGRRGPLRTRGRRRGHLQHREADRGDAGHRRRRGCPGGPYRRTAVRSAVPRGAPPHAVDLRRAVPGVRRRHGAAAAVEGGEARRRGTGGRTRRRARRHLNTPLISLCSSCCS